MFEVQADVYNLEMHYTKEIKHERLTINRLPNYDEILDKSKKLNDHRPTAKAIVTIPEEITDANQALNYADNYVTPYRMLFSFAQDHHVFFYSPKCYEIANGDRREVLGIAWSAIRVGKPWGGWVVSSDALNEFLAIAIPKLRDVAYCKRTGLKNAIIDYNESNMNDVLQTTFALLFIGLETVANAYWDNAKEHNADLTKLWVEPEKLNKLHETVKAKVDELEINEPMRGLFLSRWGWVKDPPLQLKIRGLMNSFNLPYDLDRIMAMKDFRDHFFHGDEIDINTKYRGMPVIELLRDCNMLLCRVILKLLGFYVGWPKVHIDDD